MAQPLENTQMTAEQERQQNWNEIDQNLDALVNKTGQINVKAKQMGDELQTQTEMAKEINQDMTTANDKVVVANEKLQKIQDSTKLSWVCWIVIGILLILIVLFLFI